MSTGYGWEGIRQVCATLLGARHVPECLCGGRAYLGSYLAVLTCADKCSTFIFTFSNTAKKQQDIGGKLLLTCGVLIGTRMRLYSTRSWRWIAIRYVCWSESGVIPRRPTRFLCHQQATTKLTMCLTDIHYQGP